MTSCCQTARSCCDESSKGNVQKAVFSVALVGNPNCGKTTLFNALTGARQRVGNWPGVTVERKSGYFTEAGATVEVVDLPGVYSLTLASETAALDERIACDFILHQQADVIINIVDASNVDRHLYLTTQLLEMGAPIILALNMMDVAKTNQIHIDIAKLARELNCPVMTLEATKGNGVEALKRAIVAYEASPVVQKVAQKAFPYPAPIKQAINALAQKMAAIEGEKGDHDWQAMRLLEDDVYVRNLVPPILLEQVAPYQAAIQQTLGDEADILLADTRYRFIEQIIKQCLSRSMNRKPSWTSRLDSIVLNRLLGIPIFLGVMYLLFVFAINVGGAFQDFFDISSQTLFVDGFAYLLTQLGVPTWVTALLANGIGKGINTTITFIPVIGAMFLFLALLEDSGYMARAAFVIDRFMRALGLPGKAFVPMIVGFGCNVPAVMAARTLENKRDRIITIMMSPFMSCGARLAIYAVFTAAFFPRGGQNVVFALYIIGIVMAVATGLILRKTILKGDPSPLVMELPPYHLPRVKTLLLHAWQRLKGFVFRAGKLIVPICVLIGALNSLNLDGSMNTGEGDAHSLLSMVGQWVTPIFSPMGIHVENWPATVGLVTGILAKEVVVGTLNTLYTQMGHLASAASAESFHLWAGLGQAFHSIPENFAKLSHLWSHAVVAEGPAVNQGVYGLMYQNFDGKIGAFAYLLFVLLYFPCISTMAVTLRELHRGWAVFSAFWMTGVAYGAAVTFYQIATSLSHPLSSLIWVVAMITLFLGTIATIRWYANRDDRMIPIMMGTGDAA
jgi:ferrous iron transport protein B